MSLSKWVLCDGRAICTIPRFKPVLGNLPNKPCDLEVAFLKGRARLQTVETKVQLVYFQIVFYYYKKSTEDLLALISTHLSFRTKQNSNSSWLDSFLQKCSRKIVCRERWVYESISGYFSDDCSPCKAGLRQCDWFEKFRPWEITGAYCALHGDFVVCQERSETTSSLCFLLHNGCGHFCWNIIYKCFILQTETEEWR